MRCARRGFTLIELVVVLVIVGLMAAVVVPAMRKTSPPTAATSLDARIAALRDSALKLGAPVTAIVTDRADTTMRTDQPIVESDARVGVVTAYPDGSVRGTIGVIERMTGRPHAAR